MRRTSELACHVDGQGSEDRRRYSHVIVSNCDGLLAEPEFKVSESEGVPMATSKDSSSSSTLSDGDVSGLDGSRVLPSRSIWAKSDSAKVSVVSSHKVST